MLEDRRVIYLWKSCKCVNLSIINWHKSYFLQLIAELQAQLEAEKKRNKELSSNVVRLNGTVKIGQDALAEEQRLVKQLQDQLALKVRASVYWLHYWSQAS